MAARIPVNGYDILTRSAVLARSDTVTADLLAIPVNAEDPGTSPVEDESGSKPVRLSRLDEIEREHVAAVLAHARWHNGNACEILGISRPALERKIAKYGLV